MRQGRKTMRIRGRFPRERPWNREKRSQKLPKNEMNQSIERSQAEKEVTLHQPFSVVACRARARQAREFAGSAHIVACA